MISFWIIAAGMLVLALIIVIPPFLRKSRPSAVTLDELNVTIIKQQLQELEADLANGQLDQAQYDSARMDLEKELLLDIPADRNDAKTQAKSGRWAVGIAGIGIPLLSIALYQALGNQEIIVSLQNKAMAQPSAGSGSQEGLPPMEVLVEKLATRLQQDPDKIEGWMMLGRSYASMGRLDEARQTYENLYRRAPDNPQLLLNYAELLANMQNNQMAGRPTELIEKALALEPQNPNALWMSGLSRYEQGDLNTAIARWEQLAALLPADSEDRSAIGNYIEEARSKLLPSISPSTPTAVTTAAATMNTANTQQRDQSVKQDQTTNKSTIRVEISLAQELREKAAASDRVFIYARATQGPRMPLAAVSKQVRDLPLSLTLDDSMAMTPQFKLSSFPNVVVGARVSKSGNAIPQSGDLQGQVSPVAPGQPELVNVVIDSVRP